MIMNQNFVLTQKLKAVFDLIRSVNLRPKKNCYVALTCTKFENWVGRSIFFFFFFFFTYRERVEFSNIFFSKWGKLGRNAVKTHTYTSAFLSHWIQILANSSPKSDIFNKKKKKKRPCFFAFYGRSNEGNITTTTNLALWIQLYVQF